MNDTPRTDAKFDEEVKQSFNGDYWPALVAMKEHAKNLEREVSARTEEREQWIPCSERMPIGIEKPLLLYGDHEMLIMGIWNGPDSVFLAWSDELEDWREIPCRVTHWMVIPSTPVSPRELK